MSCNQNPARGVLFNDRRERWLTRGRGRSDDENPQRHGNTGGADPAGPDGITKLASKEQWQRKVEELEARARERTEEKAVENVEQMNTRHLKAMKIVQAKALEALRSMPLTSAMDAVRALDLAVKQERVVRGEPGDRTAISIEDTIRKEYEHWMTAELREDDDEDSHSIE